MSRKAETTKATGQLRLLAGEYRKQRRRDWALDEKTRKIGREGIAAVRETLRRTHPPDPIKKAS
jgi:hypothetical protein